MPRQNTSPAAFPQAVLQQIAQLAQNIAIARKRRGETQAQWAKKLGVSQPTFARIERGDPGVAMASYVMCMWLIDPAVHLADLVSPLNDRAALEHEISKVSQVGQVRRSRAESASASQAQGDFDAQEPHAIGLPDAARMASDPSLVFQRRAVKGKGKGKGKGRGAGNATAEGLAALLKTGANKP
jgi:DNA-binding XRE family transcriptional regulator